MWREEKLGNDFPFSLAQRNLTSHNREQSNSSCSFFLHTRNDEENTRFTSFSFDSVVLRIPILRRHIAFSADISVTAFPFRASGLFLWFSNLFCEMICKRGTTSSVLAHANTPFDRSMVVVRMLGGCTLSYAVEIGSMQMCLGGRSFLHRHWPISFYIFYQKRLQNNFRVRINRFPKQQRKNIPTEMGSASKGYTKK